MSEALVYITCKDKAEAEEVGRVLIEGKLAACVNIVDGMQSMFWWQGRTEKDQETVLIAKTRAGLVSPLTEKVKSVHSYDCPCVVALPIIDGNPDFLQWIREETGGSGS
ncbi:MAG: divalent-cation tolerance protein CutA [Desulfurivibrionaceae bacterium]